MVFLGFFFFVRESLLLFLLLILFCAVPSHFLCVSLAPTVVDFLFGNIGREKVNKLCPYFS